MLWNKVNLIKNEITYSMFFGYHRIKLKSIKMPGKFPNKLKLNRTSTNNPLVSEEIERKFIKHCELNVMKFIALRAYISKGKSQRANFTPKTLVKKGKTQSTKNLGNNSCKIRINKIF